MIEDLQKEVKLHEDRNNEMNYSMESLKQEADKNNLIIEQLEDGHSDVNF